MDETPTNEGIGIKQPASVPIPNTDLKEGRYFLKYVGVVIHIFKE